MSCKVTVYTQAYNTEKYIEQCINSVLNQSFKDFEYIIVDNGSTDKTKDIIDSYSKLDSRINALRFEKNQRGFWMDLLKEKAAGKYFTTLDADDYWEENYLSELYYLSEENNLDIAIGGSKFHYIGTNNVSYRKSNDLLIFTKDYFSYYFSFLYQFIRPVWGKMFKVSVLENIGYSEIEKLVYGGDTTFCIEALKFVQKIAISDKVIHNYRIHNKSASYTYNPNRISSDMFLFNKAENFLKNFGEISFENYNFLYLVYMTAIIDTLNVVLKAELSLHEKLLEMGKILNEPLTQRMFIFLYDNDEFKVFRKNVLEILSKVGIKNINNKQMIDLVYSNICLLNKNIQQYVYREDIIKHIQNDDFLLSIINLDNKKMLEKAILALGIRVFFSSTWATLYEAFTDNILLSWINNRDFVLQYPDIIKDIYLNNLPDAMGKIIEVLTKEDEIPFEEEMVFMCLNVSAMLEDGGVFIYAKKLQTQLFIQQKSFEEAAVALNDLLEMCPDDEEVLKFKEWMEEENV